jgi:hypothetical protein
MTYQEAKLQAEVHWETHRQAGKNLNDFLDQHPKGPMGLTPDAVKKSPEYIKLKADYDKAFQTLRTFNATYTKRFSNEIRADRRVKAKSAASIPA